MNRISLRQFIRKKPSSPISVSFSSYGSSFSQTIKRKTKTHKQLGILNLVSPTTDCAENRQTHLRLIQDFLPIPTNQFAQKRASDDFAHSNSLEETSNMLETNFLNEEESIVDASALSHALSLCASSRSLKSGVQFHCLAIRTGFVGNVYVGSCLISFYSKCGELCHAYRVFEEMPVKNVVSWTAIIAGFAQEWRVDGCLELYSRMRNSTLKPNDLTFTCLLSTCTGGGSLGRGRSAHCQTIEMGFDSYVHVANALISMYCKCGNVEDAYYIFERMDGKDIVSWNSMIAGHAQHGLAVQAIDLFEEMKKQKLKPDAITFLGVLSSCRHVGLVKQGQFYFNSMVEHGVKPELDHFACVVDLLGRAGLLEEARDFIVKMPIHPNAIIWGSLLSSCRLHGSVWLGIEAAENRLLLEPECAATHLQLANLYASVGCWDQAARVRKLMKGKGLKTEPGCSWIEVRNEIYRFRAEEWSNGGLTEISAVVDSLADHMRSLGYDMHEEEADDDLDTSVS
ncbi:hypothetical protein AAG906_014519 [Vitis piasezkii]